MSSSTQPLVLSLDCSEFGSRRAKPSRLPRMLVENQPSTWSARDLSAGAITVFIMVWPVLPSLPATATLRSLAKAVSAGTSAATLGVKLP